MYSFLSLSFRRFELFLVAVIGGMVLTQTAPSLAAPLNQGVLHRVYITDVRDVQFVVSWTTDTVSDGRVEWGTTTALGNTTSDSVASTTTHYVRITGLSQNMTYYFQVRSGTLVDNNGGAYYTVTTGPTLGIPPTGKLIYGYIYQSNGTTPASNAIAYLKIQDANGTGSLGDSQLVTARTDATGVWFFSNLYDVRTSNAGAYFTFSDSADNLSLKAQGGNLGTAAQIVLVPATYPALLPAMSLNGIPSSVNLSSFMVVLVGDHNAITWETTSELHNLGFNLWRGISASAPTVKLNPFVIPSQAPGGTEGHAYIYSDSAITGGAHTTTGSMTSI